MPDHCFSCGKPYTGNIPLLPDFPYICNECKNTPPQCKDCGTIMTRDLATLNKGVWWCDKCHPLPQIKDITMPRGDKGSYIYDFDSINIRINSIDKAIKEGKVAFHNIYHNTINNRIKNICNALGMSLNAKESPKLNELKELFNQLNGFVLNQSDDKWETIANIEEVLRELLQEGVRLATKHNDIEAIEIYTKLLAKLDSQGKTECKHESDLIVCEKCAHPDIVAMVNKMEKTEKKRCEHVYTSQYPYWECGKCGFHKFEKPSRCDECGGHLLSGYLLHTGSCSHLHDKQEPSGSAASSFTRRDSDPVGSTPTPDYHQIHELKTIPRYFQPLLERIKTFEIRINDRDFRVGDTLVLKEYDYEFKNKNIIGYTGREIAVEILYILKAEGSFFSFLDDYIIMGIRF